MTMAGIARRLASGGPGRQIASDVRNCDTASHAGSGRQIVATPRKLEDNPWLVTAIANEDGELAPVIEGTTPDIHFGEGQANGDASCNRFFGGYEATADGELQFGELATTMMACLEAVMEQEQAFLEALDAVDSYSIAGDVLELRSADEVLALLQAIPTTIANTAWRLTALNNGKQAVVGVVGETEITATFTEDGTLAGSSGCNTYRATWEGGDGEISIGPAMGTKKLCAGEGVMEQEARYLEVLGLVTTYRLDATRLEMFNDEGARQLQYVRV
jgi:heat shock protein HslJ